MWEKGSLLSYRQHRSNGTRKDNIQSELGSLIFEESGAILQQRQNSKDCKAKDNGTMQGKDQHSHLLSLYKLRLMNTS